MSIFADVVCHGHKGVKRAVLPGLGKINVICGANNSGKTSILECLADEKHHILGFRPEPNTGERIEKIYLGGANWAYQNYSRTFVSSVTTVLGKQSVWFSDQFDGLSESIGSLVREKGRFSLDRADSLKTALKRQLPAQPAVVLVSAKRHLDAQIQVNSSQPIAPNGGGVLNYLFAAKNSPTNSNQRQKFAQILEAFEGITGDCTFDIFITDNNILQLKFQRWKGVWIHADGCGLVLLR